MPTSDFGDRLDAATYEDDPLVGVFSADPEGGVWVPERLWYRICFVGQGYALHLLPLLMCGDSSGGDSVTLNRLQVERLRDELEFVTTRLNDDLVAGQATAVMDFLATELRQPSPAIAITVD